MKYNRLKWLIKPDVQIFLVTRFLLINMFSMASVLIVSQMFFRHLAQTGTEVGLPPSHVYFEFVTAQWANFTYWWAAICLTTVLATVVCGFYFSNKFAGPIYSMLTALKEYNAGGTVRELKLRKGDLLHDLADELNKLNKK